MITLKQNGTFTLAQLTNEELAMITDSLAMSVVDGQPILAELLALAMTMAPQKDFEAMLATLIEKRSKHMTPEDIKLLKAETNMLIQIKAMVESK